MTDRDSRRPEELDRGLEIFLPSYLVSSSSPLPSADSTFAHAGLRGLLPLDGMPSRLAMPLLSRQLSGKSQRNGWTCLGYRPSGVDEGRMGVVPA